tara:strand:+ start:678 stop:1529 length:852 start_codon:yes stop_codon:yes gene_type:complete
MFVILVMVATAMASACAFVVHLDLAVWRHGLIAFTLVTTLTSTARAWSAPHQTGWTRCAVVCATYVYRIVWLHCTVERHCLEVWPRSSSSSNSTGFFFSPLFGRLLAAVGEIVFVLGFALPAVMDHARGTRRLARAVCVMLGAAELISTIGVVLRSYLLFAIENSIWALMVASLVRQSARTRFTTKNSSYAVELLRALGVALVVYNLFIDVPMYARLHLQSEPLSLREYGLRDALRCRFRDGDDDVWRPHITWMFLNFVATPTSCVCMASLFGSRVVGSGQIK